MIALRKPVRRLTVGALDGSHGADRGRPLVAALEAGDLLTLKPYKTRRAETISLFDVYRYAIKARVAKQLLEKARERRAQLTEKRRQDDFRRSIRRGKI